MNLPSGKSAPLVDMGAQCEFCRGRSFRRSRLQLKDITTLLGLRYPVRCLLCSKRQTVSLPVARRAVPSTVKQVRAPWSDMEGVSAPSDGNGPSVVGGSSFPALRTFAPVAMPELKESSFDEASVSADEPG